MIIKTKKVKALIATSAATFALAGAIVFQPVDANAKGMEFKDLKKDQWAYESITEDYDKGLIKGYPNGTVRPNNNVTEAEFLALLVRSYEPSDSHYLATQSHWADSYYGYANTKRYPITGAVQKVKRHAPINREHVFEIVSSTQGVNYQGKDMLTRAESVQFIKNVLAKGQKDSNGSPIMQEKPTSPSSLNDLKPLPDEEKKNEVTGNKLNKLSLVEM